MSFFFLSVYSPLLIFWFAFFYTSFIWLLPIKMTGITWTSTSFNFVHTLVDASMWSLRSRQKTTYFVIRTILFFFFFVCVFCSLCRRSVGICALRTEKGKEKKNKKRKRKHKRRENNNNNNNLGCSLFFFFVLHAHPVAFSTDELFM